MILKKLYNFFYFSKYVNFLKINKYYINLFGSRSAWIKELSARLDKKKIEFDSSYSFSPHNPITNPYKVLDWTIDRLQPFLDFVDKKNEINSVLEIGCGYGTGVWLINDKFKDVTGLDISKNAIETAKLLYPESKYINKDINKFFLENPNLKYDLILSCDGPQVDEKKILDHCNYYVRIGYRPKTVMGAIIKMKDKCTGLQLAFNTTVVSKKYSKNKISKKYLKYYFSSFYLSFLRDSFKNKYIPF